MNESERWLMQWHDARPGATSRSFLRGQPSSYEWLAGEARPGERVLDLACGDGALLEILVRNGLEGATGLDMSAGELQAARERLGADVARVRLLSGRAQAIPLPDASLDLVTCHLALMLMQPVEEAIAEVRRVLAPGGRFAFVVSDREAHATGDAWSLLVKHLRPLSFSGPRIGDLRAFTEAGLRELLRHFSDVRVERLSVDLSGTLDQIFELFLDTYDAARLSPAQLQALGEALRADWRSMERPDGIVPCRLGLLGVVALR
jgi:ubiquinone/menaquinone biosynthesis C-methylase UbiE